MATASDHGETAPSFVRDLTLPHLMPWVRSSCVHTVPAFQQFFGVRPVAKLKATDDSTDGDDASSEVDYNEDWEDPKASIGRRVFSFTASTCFNFGSFFGSEAFYILFFPFLFWNVDKALARRVVYLWVSSMWFGQALKEYFMLPRPQSFGKVRCLEQQYFVEFGFPSTHTLAVICETGLIVWFAQKKDYAGLGDDFPIVFGVCIAALFSSLTAAGRVFLGVHSVPDLIGGAVVGCAALWAFTFVEETLDEWVLTNSAALYMPSIISAALLLTYPRPRRWSPTYADTAMIAGVGNGVIMASYLSTRPDVELSWLNVPFLPWLGIATARLIVGFTLIESIRVVAKKALIALFERLAPASETPTKERDVILVPYKFIAYTLVAGAAAFTAPAVFDWLGINLERLQPYSILEA